MPSPRPALIRRIGIFFQRYQNKRVSSIFQTPPVFTAPPSQASVKMSSAGAATAATLYAIASITTPDGGAKPEDAVEKKHHVKNGKGFRNPWPSYKDVAPSKIMWEMVW